MKMSELLLGGTMGFSTSATGGGGGGGSFGRELGRAGRAAWAAASPLPPVGRAGASWLKMLEREDRALAFWRSRVVSLNSRSELEGAAPVRPSRSLSSEIEGWVDIFSSAKVRHYARFCNGPLATPYVSMAESSSVAVVSSDPSTPIAFGGIIDQVTLRHSASIPPSPDDDFIRRPSLSFFGVVFRTEMGTDGRTERRARTFPSLTSPPSARTHQRRN